MSIHPSAIVETDRYGRNISVGAFCYIAKDVVLGDDVVIHPGVVIQSGVTIGNGVEIFPHAVIGKEPKGAGALSRKPEFERRIEIGESCSIGPGAVIYYDVAIGRNTLIGDNASIREQCRIGDYCIISRCVTLNYAARIGNHVRIVDGTHITGKMVIEDHVFISTLVSSTNDNALGAHGYKEDSIKGPLVRSHAMIGAGAVLLPGVEIGTHAIVGAGAVVSRDVAPHTMVMGVPARFVRKLD